MRLGAEASRRPTTCTAGSVTWAWLRENASVAVCTAWWLACSAPIQAMAITAATATAVTMREAAETGVCGTVGWRGAVVFMLSSRGAVVFRWVDCRQPAPALPAECDGLQAGAMSCRKAGGFGAGC